MFQANALECIKSKNLTLFSDIVSDTGEDEKAYPLPLDHWINRPLEEEDDKTLLMAAIDDGLHEFIEVINFLPEYFLLLKVMLKYTASSLQVLLQAGADAKAFNPELGKCPVHFACATGDLRSLQLLFANERNRADPNALVKNSGRTALHICAENGKVNLVVSRSVFGQFAAIRFVKRIKGWRTGLPAQPARLGGGRQG